MNTDGRILVIGGGVGGISAAADAAELGLEVTLVEKEPFLGGRVIMMNRYFPKMCPPTCGMEINIRRIRQNPRIRVHVSSEVESVAGEPGDYTVTIRKAPRYVTGNQPISQAHLDAVATQVPNEFNCGMDTKSALSLPHDTAFPPLHTLDKDALTSEERGKLRAAEPAGAIDLDMEEEVIEEKVGAIIVATGWKPYDVSKLENLGAGEFANVITNVMMERLAAANGPTNGKILRPSDATAPGSVAFAQCAGSRDENHLPYCSAVCCMGSLKHARYIREQLPETKITIFYIDMRAIGRFDTFYTELLEDENISFVKGKVARITEDAATSSPIIEAEEVMGGGKIKQQFDLVVLATGIVPSAAGPLNLEHDENGFMIDNSNGGGVYAAGCAKRPQDVSGTVKDGAAAVMRALQALRRQ